MARLIDADAASEAVCYNCMDRYDCQDKCSDYMEVFNISTVDAMEVVHGRWVKNGWNDYSCSVCKCQFIGHGASGWNYCPECGARMDGDSQ